MLSLSPQRPRLLFFGLLILVGLVLVTVVECDKQSVDDSAAGDGGDDDFAEFDKDHDNEEGGNGGVNGDEQDFDEDFHSNNKKKKSSDSNDKQGKEEDEEDEKLAAPAPSPESQQSSLDFEGFVEDEDDFEEEEEVLEDDEDDLDSNLIEDDEDFQPKNPKKKKVPHQPTPKLTITSIPLPSSRGGLSSYYAELLMLLGISIYLLNYTYGRYKNQLIATKFFQYHWSLLEDNFSFLGDSNLKVEDSVGTREWSRMSDSLFQLWGSGRWGCEGVLLELKLMKRQDLVSMITSIFRPGATSSFSSRDIFRCTVELSRDDMPDPLVFLIAPKKSAPKLSKEYTDLANFCPEKKSGEKYGLSTNLIVMTELQEGVGAFLDEKTRGVLNKCEGVVEGIHFSDYFVGVKGQEPELTKEGLQKPPDPKRLLIFTFLLPLTTTGSNIDSALDTISPLLPLVFYTIDRMKKIKLSKDGKLKAERNRAKVEEAWMKQTSSQRAEVVAMRKEEKRRLEKERMMQEEDPAKQRRWEEKEQKREKKKKQPKLKQLKVKAM